MSLRLHYVRQYGGKCGEFGRWDSFYGVGLMWEWISEGDIGMRERYGKF